MAMAVTTMLRGIIDDIDYDVKLARTCEDMTDPYYQGYVTALDYTAKQIVGKRLEYVGGNVEQRLNEGEQMTSNKGAAGFTVRMQASRNDFERYLHSMGDTGVEKEASIIETSIAKRILDMCIKRCKLELQNEKDAQCKALENVAEIIFDKSNATIEELCKTTGLSARNNLIGQIKAYSWTLNIVNTMLQPAAKTGQEADNAD